VAIFIIIFSVQNIGLAEICSGKDTSTLMPARPISDDAISDELDSAKDLETAKRDLIELIRPLRQLGLSAADVIRTISHCLQDYPLLFSGTISQDTEGYSFRLSLVGGGYCLIGFSDTGEEIFATVSAPPASQQNPPGSVPEGLKTINRIKAFRDRAFTRDEFQQERGFSETTVRTELAALVRLGILKIAGKEGNANLYRLTGRYKRAPSAFKRKIQERVLRGLPARPDTAELRRARRKVSAFLKAAGAHRTLEESAGFQNLEERLDALKTLKRLAQYDYAKKKALTEVDLHTHTYHSDGLKSPAALVYEAYSKGVKAIAITDHNSFEGILEAIEAGRILGVEVIPGIEMMTADYEGFGTEVLVYFPDAGRFLEWYHSEESEKFRKRMGAAQAKHGKITERLLRDLKKDYPGLEGFTWREVADMTPEVPALPGFLPFVLWEKFGQERLKEIFGRADLNGVQDVYDKVFKPYIKEYMKTVKFIKAEEVAALTEKNGGVACLAHPKQYLKNIRGRRSAKRRALKEYIETLGVQAIQVNDVRNSPEDTEMFVSIADELGLIKVSGSDTHSDVDSELGSGAPTETSPRGNLNPELGKYSSIVALDPARLKGEALTRENVGEHASELARIDHTRGFGELEGGYWDEARFLEDERASTGTPLEGKWDMSEMAVVDGQPVGYYIGIKGGNPDFGVPADAWNMLRIAIDPDYRNMQIGSRLIRNFAEKADAAGVQDIYLDVTVAREDTIRFYRRCGFEVVAEEVHKGSPVLKMKASVAGLLANLSDARFEAPREDNWIVMEDGARIHKTATVDPGCTVKGPRTVICAGAHVMKGSVIHNAIVRPNVRVKASTAKTVDEGASALAEFDEEIEEERVPVEIAQFSEVDLRRYLDDIYPDLLKAIEEGTSARVEMADYLSSGERKAKIITASLTFPKSCEEAVLVAQRLLHERYGGNIETRLVAGEHVRAAELHIPIHWGLDITDKATGRRFYLSFLQGQFEIEGPMPTRFVKVLGTGKYTRIVEPNYAGRFMASDAGRRPPQLVEIESDSDILREANFDRLVAMRPIAQPATVNRIMSHLSGREREAVTVRDFTPEIRNTLADMFRISGLEEFAKLVEGKNIILRWGRPTVTGEDGRQKEVAASNRALDDGSGRYEVIVNDRFRTEFEAFLADIGEGRTEALSRDYLLKMARFLGHELGEVLAEIYLTSPTGMNMAADDPRLPRLEEACGILSELLVYRGLRRVLGRKGYYNRRVADGFNKRLRTNRHLGEMREIIQLSEARDDERIGDLINEIAGISPDSELGARLQRRLSAIGVKEELIPSEFNLVREIITSQVRPANVSPSADQFTRLNRNASNLAKGSMQQAIETPSPGTTPESGGPATAHPELEPERWHQILVRRAIDSEEIRQGLLRIREDMLHLNRELDQDQQLLEKDFTDQVIDQYADAAERFNEVILNGPMDAVRFEEEYLLFHSRLGAGGVVSGAGEYSGTVRVGILRAVEELFASLFTDGFEQRIVDDPVREAARAYVTLVNLQPFNDGNKRAANLVMNYILMKAGYEPFVLREDNVADYQRIVSPIREENEIDESEFREFLEGEVGVADAAIRRKLAQNLIERTHITDEGDFTPPTTAHPEFDEEGETAPAGPAIAKASFTEDEATLRKFGLEKEPNMYDKVRAQLFRAALDETGGNVKRAAELMGVRRSNFDRFYHGYIGKGVMPARLDERWRNVLFKDGQLIPLAPVYKDIDRMLRRVALDATGDNISAAAELLGTGRVTLSKHVNTPGKVIASEVIEEKWWRVLFEEVVEELFYRSGASILQAAAVLRVNPDALYRKFLERRTDVVRHYPHRPVLEVDRRMFYEGDQPVGPGRFLKVYCVIAAELHEGSKGSLARVLGISSPTLRKYITETPAQGPFYERLKEVFTRKEDLIPVADMKLMLYKAAAEACPGKKTDAAKLLDAGIRTYHAFVDRHEDSLREGLSEEWREVFFKREGHEKHIPEPGDFGYDMASFIDWIEETRVQQLSDDQFKAKTEELKEALKEGASLDGILPEAFAVFREAARRCIQKRPTTEQVLAAISLHQGRAVEMEPSEGKTLAIAMAAYLNALSGKGVHIHTFNDYLCLRDCQDMGGIFAFLGLRVGAIAGYDSYTYTTEETTADEETAAEEGRPEGMENLEEISRRNAYDCDITYGEKDQFVFDFLWDQKRYDPAQQVQRRSEPEIALVDEADSSMIDEARYPLVISERTKGFSMKAYRQIYAAVTESRKTELKEGRDYKLDERNEEVELTTSEHQLNACFAGVATPRKLTGNDKRNLIRQALKARHFYRREVDYVVKDGEMVIVDKITGRNKPMHLWRNHIHQFVQAKEKVRITRAYAVAGRTTYQSYYRRMKERSRLAAITGTMGNDAKEIRDVYGLEAVAIPLQFDLNRTDEGTVVHKGREAHMEAIVADVKRANKAGKPVLVFVPEIGPARVMHARLSTELSDRIEAGLAECNLLDGQQAREEEAGIIADVAKMDQVTVSTNFGGRGVNYKLGEGVNEIGGLGVIMTEPNPAKRIDDQQERRTARRGDFGWRKARYYRGCRLYERFGIEDAQEKSEAYYRDLRAKMLRFDEELDPVREEFYRLRDTLLYSGVEATEKEERLKEMDALWVKFLDVLEEREYAAGSGDDFESGLKVYSDFCRDGFAVLRNKVMDPGGDVKLASLAPEATVTATGPTTASSEWKEARSGRDDGRGRSYAALTEIARKSHAAEKSKAAGGRSARVCSDYAFGFKDFAGEETPVAVQVVHTLVPGATEVNSQYWVSAENGFIVDTAPSLNPLLAHVSEIDETEWVVIGPEDDKFRPYYCMSVTTNVDPREGLDVRATGKVNVMIPEEISHLAGGQTVIEFEPGGSAQEIMRELVRMHPRLREVISDAGEIDSRFRLNLDTEGIYSSVPDMTVYGELTITPVVDEAIFVRTMDRLNNLRLMAQDAETRNEVLIVGIDTDIGNLGDGKYAEDLFKVLEDLKARYKNLIIVPAKGKFLKARVNGQVESAKSEGKKVNAVTLARTENIKKKCYVGLLSEVRLISIDDTQVLDGEKLLDSIPITELVERALADKGFRELILPRPDDAARVESDEIRRRYREEARYLKNA